MNNAIRDSTEGGHTGSFQSHIVWFSLCSDTFFGDFLKVIHWIHQSKFCNFHSSTWSHGDVVDQRLFGLQCQRSYCLGLFCCGADLHFRLFNFFPSWTRRESALHNNTHSIVLIVSNVDAALVSCVYQTIFIEWTCLQGLFWI